MMWRIIIFLAILFGISYFLYWAFTSDKSKKELAERDEEIARLKKQNSTLKRARGSVADGNHNGTQPKPDDGPAAT